MAYTDIDKPTDYFNTKLYTGNGGTQSISSVGFQPDWVWLKARSSAYSHQLFDSVRGATKLLSSEETSAEQTLSGVTAFGSDGFTVGSDAGSNNNTTTFASWNWLASNSTASNSDGSITSTVSANTTSGFSIVSYTGNGTAGATVGHGLGVKPSMMIIKTRESLGNWITFHGTQPATKYLELNNTGALGTSTAPFNDTEPTSSVFTLGTWSNTNDNGNDMIAYCFSEVKGFSKFGSYTGNGNADGPFIYTGFKPAWIITKSTGATGGWEMHDNKRSPFNSSKERLFAHDNNEEVTQDPFVDLLSNGFKIRATVGNINASTDYIYMAFAESPFVTSTGIPTTAR